MSTDPLKNIQLDETLLKPFLEARGPGLAPSRRLAAFIQQQCSTWPRLRAARDALSRAALKRVRPAELDLYIQSNPGRINNVSAPVDRQSVAERPCFLCPENLYPEQKGLAFEKDWHILNNPFPIFLNHLVINHNRHAPQCVDRALDAMIAFVRHYSDYTVFFNGPECGASAPDHLHFQACPDGTLPATAQLTDLSQQALCPWLRLLCEDSRGRCLCGTVDRRGLLLCTSVSDSGLTDLLRHALSYLRDQHSGTEPMVNLIIFSSGSAMMGIVFPRRAHRPACYYARGREHMLVSPGAVDVGGLVILPRPEDFDKMDGPVLLDIFSEVCCGEGILEGLSF